MKISRRFLDCLLCIALTVGVASAEDMTNLKAALQANFPDGHIRSVTASSSIKGWYEVVTDDELVYANSDASLLFVGRVVDVKSKQDLTSVRWNSLQSIDFSGLPLNLAIKTVKGNGSRTIAVFSDPHCPYCQKLEQELTGINDVTIYTFLYPLETIHPGATAQAENIWCARDRATAWSEWMLQKKDSGRATSCDTHTLGTLQDVGNKLRINSTPTMFFADGRRVSGAIEMAALEQQLLAAAASRPAGK